MHSAVEKGVKLATMSLIKMQKSHNARKVAQFHPNDIHIHPELDWMDGSPQSELIIMTISYHIEHEKSSVRNILSYRT